MLTRVPDYYEAFHCLAGACPHTCCEKWEVVVDEETARRYQETPGSLGERLREVPVGKPVYVICQSGLRSYIACRILAQQGFKCYNLSGGWRLYETVVRDRTAAQEAWPCGMEK